MSIMKMCSVMLGMAVASGAVIAEETVTVGGITATCPNSCVVTQSGNTVTIRDSKGAPVKFTFRTIEE